MKLVCGLGNPGLKYKDTRHNIGYLAIDNFVKKSGKKLSGDIVLLKPQLFMNNSGAALAKSIDRLKVGIEDILIVCDDINLELGVIRFRSGGSAGGHKGLQSIIEELGTEDFNRLRIGIGVAKDTVLKDYVLSKFETGERKTLKVVLDRASEAVNVWIEEGIEAAMNKFNEKNRR